MYSMYVTTPDCLEEGRKLIDSTPFFDVAEQLAIAAQTGADAGEFAVIELDETSPSGEIVHRWLFNATSEELEQIF